MLVVSDKLQNLFYCWMFLPFLATNAVKVCKLDDKIRVVTFSSLVEFQASTSSFDPDQPTYKGNMVDFNFKSIDRLQRNAFISFGSNSIIKISLNNKGIQIIEDGAFTDLFCLHHLELRRNNISNLTAGVFNGLENLCTLDLSENALQHISSNGMIFHPLYKLKTLNLSKNSIIALNTFDFFNLTSLEVLNLSFNKINAISPDLFNYLHSLKELCLNNNNLIDIDPEKWKKLTNLETLNLAGNYLTKFDPTYNFSFINLKKLNISQNSLQILNVFALRKSLPNLKTIDISENDWYCYDLTSITHYLADSKITVLGNVNCSISKDYSYKHPTTVEYLTSTSTISSTSIIMTSDNNTRDYSKYIFVQNDEILVTTNKVLQNIQKLQTVLGYLCAIIVVSVLIGISVRIGLCHNLYYRMVGRQDANNESDRERLILLRS